MVNMAEEAKKANKPKRPKQDALVTWRMEWFPVQNSQNKMYTDKLVGILDKRVRKTPVIFALYNHGRPVFVGQSEQGVSRLRAHINSNKKRMWFDRLALYTLAKRRQLNDVEALMNRIMWPQKQGKNFMRAKNLADPVKRDVKVWAWQESKKINRALRPLEKKLNRTVTKLDRKETKIRKVYARKIERAKDKNKQRHLRSVRDQKLKIISAERKRLQPWRNNITQWTAKLRTFQNMKV